MGTVRVVTDVTICMCGTMESEMDCKCDHSTEELLLKSGTTSMCNIT